MILLYKIFVILWYNRLYAFKQLVLFKIF